MQLVQQQWRCQHHISYLNSAAKNTFSSPTVTRLNRRSKVSATKRVVWIETSNQAVLTSAVESGYTYALFQPGSENLIQQWQQLAAFTPLTLQSNGAILDSGNKKVGQLLQVSSKAAINAAAAAAQQPGYLIMDATDWKVIPAENLVAAFQSGPGKLLGVAESAAEARVLLEALEAGTAGVVLRTEDPLQVKQLAAYLAEQEAEQAPQFQYEVATVTRVEPVGLCDRVCVDLCSLLQPGEGMLVGSFARALFLVHSEVGVSLHGVSMYATKKPCVLCMQDKGPAGWAPGSTCCTDWFSLNAWMWWLHSCALTAGL
eukprot:GHRR01033291.1.p1 GENE.GHRR01033291.1~~GHRR01033291.1.p1  ORF type:complete len:315 (+),score=113.06 GHRR01033291.1:588-1532(+)